MKRYLITFVCMLTAATMAAADAQQRIQDGCMRSLLRFMEYAKSIYVDAGVNSRGDSVGYFKALSAGQSNEDGVRTNADMAMVVAFVNKYGKQCMEAAADNSNGQAEAQPMSLPDGITFGELQTMALRALRYAYSTHRSNRLMRCTDGHYWGSSPDDDGHREQRHQWESSLWTLSVVLAGEFLGDVVQGGRACIENMVVSECDFQLVRPVPTGYQGDTKAEENGWEANVLACGCGLLPGHAHADKWREAMNRFAFNCYTVAADAADTTRVEGRMAKDWYEGQNLYDDFTLQNHNYFHTSYQNVVMQEQAESMVALKMMGALADGHVSESLTWHWGEVWSQVLAQLSLVDGEMAMPNGNDWSMFLFDQLPAYAAMSAIMHHPDALMLEERCLQSLVRRQQTTADGSYMLHPDIGARRMGVTAHRVMMTWLMHELFPADIVPSTWDDFLARHCAAKEFPSQHVVRGMSKDRFTCFSWSKGLKNCTGIIVPNTPDASKTMIPYKQAFGGNLIGEPERMVEQPAVIVKGNEWVVFAGGHHPFCIWSTPGNAVIVLNCGVNMALSFDPLTSEVRDIRHGQGWVSIDNSIGIVGGKEVELRQKGVVNSINTAVLVSEKADAVVYYSNVSQEQTSRLAGRMQVSREGNVIKANVEDTDGTLYRLEYDMDSRRVKKYTERQITE